MVKLKAMYIFKRWYQIAFSRVRNTLVPTCNASFLSPPCQQVVGITCNSADTANPWVFSAIGSQHSTLPDTC